MQAAARGRPVQRLDADRIAGQVDPAAMTGRRSRTRTRRAAGAPRSRPTGRTPAAMTSVSLSAAELVAERAQLGAQRAVVVDLAVVAEQPAAVGREPRLDRPGRIDDPQPLRPGQQADRPARPPRPRPAVEQRRASGRTQPRSGEVRRSARCRTRSVGCRAGDCGLARPLTRSGRRQTCQAWPSSMTLTSPARCRSSSSPRSSRCAWNRRYHCHLDVGGVADAVRARQQGDVAERLQVPLMLDAAGHAGHPQRRSSVGRDLRELVGELVEPGDRLRPGPGQPESGGPRRTAWQGPPLGRPRGPR